MQAASIWVSSFPFIPQLSVLDRAMQDLEAQRLQMHLVAMGPPRPPTPPRKQQQQQQHRRWQQEVHESVPGLKHVQRRRQRHRAAAQVS